MPNNPLNDELDSISSTIGELRADNRRNAEGFAQVLTELRRISERMDGIAQLNTELREYRKTLHDRFNRINEIAAEINVDVEKLNSRIDILEDTKLPQIDKQITQIETSRKFNWKVLAIAGTAIMTILGWVVGNQSLSLLKGLFSGG